MDISQDIKTNGYILLKNKLNEKELNFGLSSIEGKKVNYVITKQFIDNILLIKIKENIKIMNSPRYVKFRLSNNNNSTDASTFHGDIYNKTDSEILPIYTCLCYFDEAQLEVIPGSHKYNNGGCSITSYNKRKILYITRGDILIFYSNMHHRGINYNQTENRRLLQVFEVFPNKEIYDEHVSKLIIIKSGESILMKKIVGPMSYVIANYPTLINFISIIHYVLMYNDMHYKMALLDISPIEKTNRYVSYEAGIRKKFKDLIDNESLNVNIICDYDVNSVSYGTYYLYSYIIYWIISLIILYLFFKMWKNTSKYNITKISNILHISETNVKKIYKLLHLG